MSRVSALRRWLALEHEAVWTYGLLGARFPELTSDARDAWTAHRATRDRLLALVAQAGGTPVAAQGSYGTGRPRDVAAAKERAAGLEDRICAACVELVGTDDVATRRLALAGLRTAALAAITWGANPDAFPGLT